MLTYRFMLFVAFTVTTCVQSQIRCEEPFDIVIRNGTIVDGTGNPWFVGDVALRGDRIADVGRTIQGATRLEIDARGMVVAPGFIDIHSHSDYLLLEDGNAQSKLPEVHISSNICRVFRQ